MKKNREIDNGSQKREDFT